MPVLSTLVGLAGMFVARRKIRQIQHHMIDIETVMDNLLIVVVPE